MNKAWAQRYCPNFDLAENFLEQSRQAVAAEAQAEEKRRQRELKRTRIFAAILALAFLAAATLAWMAREQQQRAQESDKINRQLYYVANLNLAQSAFWEGNYTRSQELLSEFLPSASRSDMDIRSFAWYYLWRLNHDEKATLKGHGSSVWSVAFTPDGRLLASGSGDDTVKLWIGATDAEVAAQRTE